MHDLQTGKRTPCFINNSWTCAEKEGRFWVFRELEDSFLLTGTLRLRNSCTSELLGVRGRCVGGAGSD